MKRMDSMQTERLKQIDTTIAEALAHIDRQRQMIADFQARGYDVRAPLTLLASLLLNLRRLEDARRAEYQRAGGTIAQPTSSGCSLCR
jgi:hypothetical protein